MLRSFNIRLPYKKRTNNCSLNFRRLLAVDSTPTDPKSLKWGDLGFHYVPTASTVMTTFEEDKWNYKFSSSEPFVKLHVLANVLHYGQAVFEGLKAFSKKDGSVLIFNPKENAARMKKSGLRLGMPEMPEDLFLKCCEEVVKANKEYVPPYGTGGSLYIRPFFFGSGAKLGLGPADEYVFGAISSPVGLYYPTGLKPVDAKVIENFDRAAPLGIGAAKTPANYVADILPAKKAAEEGFPASLYLDAKEHKYVEEFSSSNFIAISKDKSTYVTPNSESVLKSITNKMLVELAKKRGLKVEHRPIAYEEIENGEFSEVAACGTAVIVTPIKSVTRNGVKTEISSNLEVLNDLYEDIRALQVGDKEDEFGWCHSVTL